MPLPSDTLSSLTKQLHSAPWTWAGAWVRCSTLHAKRILIVGDAAHAVSPSLGQGCNAALEDITVGRCLLAGVGCLLAGEIVLNNRMDICGMPEA